MGLNKRKIIFLSSLLSVIFLAGVIFLTSRLTKQRQEIRKKAASSAGTATVSFAPASGNFLVGQTFPVAVKINPNGVNISSVQISFNYDFAGQAPEIEIEDADLTKPGIQIPKGNLPLNYDLPNSNIALIDTQSKKVTVILAAFSLTGYTSSQEVTLTTINFKAISPVNQKTISFDPTLSKITKLEDGQDVLKTPTSTGTYQVEAGPIVTVTPPMPTITTEPSEYCCCFGNSCDEATGCNWEESDYQCEIVNRGKLCADTYCQITPAPTITPTSSLTPAPSPTPFVCPRGSKGNLDCDQSGIIDSRDLGILLDNWAPNGPAPAPAAGHWTADLTGDNKVNEADLNILLTNWGWPSTLITPTPKTTPIATLTPTPVPTTLIPTPTPLPNFSNCPQPLPVEDSHIDAYNPTRNYDNPEHSNNQIKLYKGNISTPQRGLVKFDLSSLTDTQISKAYLRVYVAGWSGTNGIINVYQIKQPWKETEVTWNKADNTTPWQKPGANGENDRIFSPITSATTTGIYCYLNFDITNLAKSWLAQPQTNQGVMLIVGTPGVPDKSSNKSFILLSTEFPHSAGGPCLITE